MRPQKLGMKPKEEAVYFSSMGKDKDLFNVQFINSVKGRGVFSRCHIQKGEFLIEYRGDLINKREHENRLRIYHYAVKVFMFEFRYKGKKFCIDAAREDDSLGRLVNDDHISPNSKMKTITVNGKPHLCLFAIKDIEPGEEITYNYGNFDWPWRLKCSLKKEQLQSEDLLSHAAGDATEKIFPEADPHHTAVAMTSDSLRDVKQVSAETDSHLTDVAMTSDSPCENTEQVSADTDPHPSDSPCDNTEQLLGERDSPILCYLNDEHHSANINWIPVRYKDTIDLTDSGQSEDSEDKEAYPQIQTVQVERSVLDVLTEPGFGEAQGSRSVKIRVDCVEEQQFVHLAGQRADVSQVNRRERSAKPSLPQPEERANSLPPVSPVSSAETIESCGSSNK